MNNSDKEPEDVQNETQSDGKGTEKIEEREEVEENLEEGNGNLHALGFSYGSVAS
ncbi:hypothetical protein BGZ95_002992 [Linnemannia exigua]|uniref:Uncharacterized protein n=1 Tax=Linnemannia exigua TaxID=604196 RepID=A0AAD4DKD8_9FUNG|nr:hypothetical protein BGZ95_002992 [Linnemannia exigua]